MLGIIGAVLGLSRCSACSRSSWGWSNARERIATNKGRSIAGTVLGAVALALGIAPPPT